MKTILAAIIALSLTLLLTGLPQDAFQAYFGAKPGDRLRYFNYLQTVRHEDVPSALMKYGVKPN